MNNKILGLQIIYSQDKWKKNVPINNLASSGINGVDVRWFDVVPCSVACEKL